MPPLHFLHASSKPGYGPQHVAFQRGSEVKFISQYSVDSRSINDQQYFQAWNRILWRRRKSNLNGKYRITNVARILISTVILASSIYC